MQFREAMKEALKSETVLLKIRQDSLSLYVALRLEKKK